MPTLAELKASSPAYAQMSDDEFAQRVYDKHYKDKVPYAEFVRRTGFSSEGRSLHSGLTREQRQAQLRTLEAQAPQSPTEGFRSTLQFATPWETYDTGVELPESVSLGLAGAGKSFVDTGRGLKQAGTELALAAAERLPQERSLSSLITGEQGGVAGSLRASLAEQQAAIDQSRETDQALMDTGAGVAGNVLGYGAQLLGPGAALRGTMAARAALPATFAGNVAQGAAVGGLQPVATGESRIGNAALGAAAGGAGQAVARGLGALATRARSAIPDEVRAAYEAAKSRGIELSPVQLSDSRFLKRLHGMLGSLPFTGTSARQEARVGQFNRELAKEIGEPKAAQVDSQTYARAKARQSAQYDDLTSRNAMKVDDGLLRSLTNIAESSKMAGDQVRNQVESAIDALYAQATTGPGGVVIPGRAFQAFDSQLGNIIKSGGPTAHFLGNVQSAVRKAMDNSISPQDAAAWKALRREYGNRKTLAPLVAKSADEPIPPAQLMGAVTNSKSAKEAMASGTRGGLGELAKIGQRMKPPSSSGTAENLWAGGILNMSNWPAYAVAISGGAPLGRVMDSQTLVKFIMRENPGMTRQAAAKLAERLAVPAAASHSNQRGLTFDISGGTSGPAIPESRLNELRGGL